MPAIKQHKNSHRFSMASAVFTSSIVSSVGFYRLVPNTRFFSGQSRFHDGFILLPTQDQRMQLLASIVRLIFATEFLVSKEPVVLRRWERSKQKFGFIKRVDKG